MNLLKKITLIFFSLLLVLSSSLLVPASALAATPAPLPTAASAGTWFNQSFGDWHKKVYDTSFSPGSEIFGERYTAAQVQWVIYGFFSFILNSSFGNDPNISTAISCFISNTVDVNTCFSALDNLFSESSQSFNTKPQDDRSLSQLVFATNRPFSGISYVKDGLNKFDLVPEAKAQNGGFGFNNALEPAQGMWRASRDIAFGLFVLGAMILAFMIMFRVKINPQTVISVQSAIPKLIIALVLVTFSYAIAGFLVDLMYIVYGLLSLTAGKFIPLSIFNSQPSPTAMFNFFTGGRLLGIPVDLGVIGMVVVYAFFFMICFVIVLFLTLGVLPSLIATGVTVISFLTPLAGFLTLIGIFLVVVVLIFLILTIVKTIFSLLKAYLNIILLTVFAPIQIVVGSVVQSVSFGQWVRSFVSNLAVFVVTSLMFFLAFVFMLEGFGIAILSFFGPISSSFIVFLFNFLIGTQLTQSAANAKVPGGWPPLIGGAEGSLGLLYLGLSLVIFTLIPKANDIVQSFIAGKPFAYGTAFAEAVGQYGDMAYTYSGLKDTVEGYRKRRMEDNTNTRIKSLEEGLRWLQFWKGRRGT